MIRITIEKFHAEREDYSKRGVVFDDEAPAQEILDLVETTLSQIREDQP